MERRDYLEKQIDQLGKALGKMVASLLGIRDGSTAPIGIETVSQTLKKEIDLDIDTLLAIQPDELIEVLAQSKGLSDENLEKLAELLFIVAHDLPNDVSRRNSFYERSLSIYEYVERTGRCASFDRHVKIDLIKKTLSQ